MAGDFDVVTKSLLETRPGDWLWLAGRENAPAVTVIDADLATVSAAADKVLSVAEAFDGRPAWLLHFEFATSHDLGVLGRMAQYRALLERRHGLAVGSVLVLMRREANSPRFTDEYRVPAPLGGEHVFVYRTVRLWELPADPFLAGGTGTLPLAVLTAVGEPEVPGIVTAMRGRVEAELSPPERNDFWMAVSTLMGLRFAVGDVNRWLGGVQGMRDSVTYQAMRQLERGEGRVEGQIDAERRLLLRYGVRRFGEPDAATRQAVEAITDLARLERLHERMLDAASWEDLLSGEAG